MTEQSDELEILLPVHHLQIAGGTITLHEYTFLEGLRVDAIAAPFIDDLKRLFIDRAPDDPIALGDLAAVFGGHPRILTELLAIACDLARDWIEALSDEDGQLLLLNWWAVNKGFFVRRLVQEMAAHQAMKWAADPSAGASALPG